MLYVTISGAGAGAILPHLDRQGLPKEVVFVQDATALVNDELLDVRSRPFAPVVASWRDAPTTVRKDRSCRLGQCAAQKLLNRIFADARRRNASGASEVRPPALTGVITMRCGTAS
ncbi:hypothetical protein ACIA8R_02775 [Nonomuraea sp. NPDC051191]